MGNRRQAHWIEALDRVSKTRNINARGVRSCIAESLSCGPPEWAREMLVSALGKDVSNAKEVISTLLARCSEAAEPCNKNAEIKERNKKNNGISESLLNRMDIDQTKICFPESVTDCCRNAFREITMKDKFGELFNLVQNKQKEMLDFNLIDIRLNMGTYGKAPELFASDMQKMWENVRAVGQKIILLANSLSEYSDAAYQKEVATLFGEKAGDKDLVDGSENMKVGSDTEEHLHEPLHNLNQHHLSEANNQLGCNTRAEEHNTASNLCNLNENGQNGRLNGGLEAENTSPNEDIASKDVDSKAQCVSNKQCDSSELSAQNRVCRSCGANERDNFIVLCDACKAAYHIYCISPALEHVPSEVCERLSKELEPENSGVAEFHTGGGHMGTYCDRNVACSHGNKGGVDINQGEGAGREDTEVHASTEEEKLHSNEPLPKVCKVCSSGERDSDNLIECANTNCLFKYFHLSCLKPPLKCNPPANWYCPSCICMICKIDENDDQIVLCDGCDDGYHIYCVKPRLSAIPKRNWYCSSCRKMKRRRRTNKERYPKGNASTEGLQGSNPSMIGNTPSGIGRGVHNSQERELHISIPQDQLQATQLGSTYSIAPEEPGVNSDENFGSKDDFRISFRTRNTPESEEGAESKESGKRKRKSSEPRKSEGQEEMGRG
ncbi:hypothetical protein SUGI_0407210 [Cryptomeria japonica]|nr:hypothetical protein SUGI_0407210 [Cryptomeria japonica]